MQAKLQSYNKNRYHFCFRYHQGNIYVIDVSQSVEHDHVHALEFLRKDCTNITGNVHVFEYRRKILFCISLL
jgi:RIO kinase 1